MNKRVVIIIFLALMVLGLSSCGVVTSLIENSPAIDNQGATVTPPHTVVQAKSFATFPTLAPDDPSVLYFDDFSDNYSGWEEESTDEGTKGYTGGSYSILVNQANFCHWSHVSRTLSDADIEVDMKWLHGTFGDEFGVICRLKDDDNYYYAGITNEGYYGIGKFSNGEWVELGDEDWGFNDQVIKTGNGINHLKFSCNYENLSLTVNGSELLTVIDPEIRSGAVGLYVCSYEEPGAEVIFDNFAVTSP